MLPKIHRGSTTAEIVIRMSTHNMAFEAAERALALASCVLVYTSQCPMPYLWLPRGASTTRSRDAINGLCGGSLYSMS